MDVNVVVLAPAEGEGRQWQYTVEDLSDAWRCMPVTTAEAALPLLDGAQVLLLLPCAESDALLALLESRPPLTPPYILGGPDGPLPAVEELPGIMASWQEVGRLPALHDRQLARTKEMAAALLRAMDVPPRLRAWAFLPEMLALTVVHPPLLTNLRRRLYPMIAARHGMTAAGVERSLRLCIESTWSHGSLAALERFFGMSVDPEKGKPTNAAFLRRVSALVREGMQRLIQR